MIMHPPKKKTESRARLTITAASEYTKTCRKQVQSNLMGFLPFVAAMGAGAAAFPSFVAPLGSRCF